MAILKIIYFTFFFFIIRGFIRYLIGQTNKLPPSQRAQRPTRTDGKNSNQDQVIDVEFSRKND